MEEVISRDEQGVDAIQAGLQKIVQDFKKMAAAADGKGEWRSFLLEKAAEIEEVCSLIG